MGLREGAMVRSQFGSSVLKGSSGARVFRRGHEPVEVESNQNLDDFILVNPKFS
jgi:hypothetical protein